MDLGLHFGSHFGIILEPRRHLAAKSGKRYSKKGVLREVENQAPKKMNFRTSREGVRRVPVSTGAPFSLFGPYPFWLHLGSHFGIDLEAQIATILLLCCHWWSIDRLWGFLFDVRSPQGSSRGLATLEALSPGGGGVEAKCGF